MITRLQEINSPARNSVDEPMLLCNSSGPRAAKLVLEWFRLANPLEWIFHDILNQEQDSKGYFSVRLHPPA